MSADLDVAVVSSVPLIECFENINLMPAKMKSPGRGHSAMISMLLDVNTHFGSRVHSKRMLCRLLKLLSAAVQASWQGASLHLPLLSSCPGAPNLQCSNLPLLGCAFPRGALLCER
jgi:hypothetical protein